MPAAAASCLAPPQTELQGVSLIVPCFEELASIDQLGERIEAVKRHFAHAIDLQVVLVDDGSGDGTGVALAQRFGGVDWAEVVYHERNQGIAAAILTGARAARHDLVVSMDADCTYDPQQLSALVAAMRDGVVLVTASPYHPQGLVEGVPAWRLWLSKVASRLYGRLLGLKLHTYTSCFRAYRRSSLLELELHHPGFVGIAEMLWRISAQGAVAEVPATLTSRRLGYSKMRTVPVAWAHLKLMCRILIHKIVSPVLHR